MTNDIDAELHPAATVVVLRDAEAGLETLLLRRSGKLAFYGGAWVFPGGRIDAADHASHDASATHAARRAAVRELQEEAGLSLAPDGLAYFAHWVTPPGRTRRFDTWFFVASAAQTEVRIDQSEVDAHRWMTMDAALQARARGEIELPPPTFVTLNMLRAHATAAAALCALNGARVLHYAPRLCSVDDSLVHLYAGDAGYDARDPALTGPRHRLVVEGERWSYDCSGLTR